MSEGAKEREESDKLPSIQKDDDVTESEIQSKEVPTTLESEMDAGSECFNPLRVLYAKDTHIMNKSSSVQYQNLAAFESALKKFGVWGLQEKPNKSGSVQASGSKSQKMIVEEEKEIRRFLPHQMTIKTSTDSGINQRQCRNLWKTMSEIQGPLKELSDSIVMKRRVRIIVRNEHGVRGHIEGNIICFDKHWNILLKNVEEVWRRRKFKYGINKTCEAGNLMEDCTQRLAELGITLPQQTAKSLNRKNVEIKRTLEQLMVRGEQIVLVKIIGIENG